MSKMVLGFYRLSDAYPTFPKDRNIVHEISLGYYNPKGGCRGEFIIEFVDLDKLTPRIHMFNDSWKFLTDPKWKKFFATLAKYDSTEMSYLDMINLLHRLGFKDFTRPGFSQ